MKKDSNVRWGWLTLALFFPLAAHAELYKWVDEDGNVTYSQTAPPGKKNVDTVRVQRGPTPPLTAKPANNEGKKAGTETGEETKSKAASQDVDAIRKQNCEASRTNLRLYTTFKRVQNDKGEVTVLDNETRASKIKESEEDVKRYCTD